MIALPWLALTLTGSPIALGTILAVMAVPRAALMLVGGVYVDRLSPRRVMVASNAVRLACLLVLASTLIAGVVELWMLYLFAIVFGIADAFFIPAQNSIVPSLVKPEQLQKPNGLFQGTLQLSVFVGPALAGLAIGALGSPPAARDQIGLAMALLIDAFSFVVSIATLLLIKLSVEGQPVDETMTVALRGAVTFVNRNLSMRYVLFVIVAVNFLVVGPFNVGLPTLAYTRLPEGPAALGALMSAMGGGALLGMAAVAMLPPPRATTFGTAIMLVLASTGVGVAALAFVSSTAVAFAIVFCLGAATGFGSLNLITWAQQRVPEELMGRVMSLIGFGSLALLPVSQALAGFLIGVSLDGLLVIAGLTMAMMTTAFAFAPHVRNMGLEPMVGRPTT